MRPLPASLGWGRWEPSRPRCWSPFALPSTRDGEYGPGFSRLFVSPWGLRSAPCGGRHGAVHTGLGAADWVAEPGAPGPVVHREGQACRGGVLGAGGLRSRLSGTGACSLKGRRAPGGVFSDFPRRRSFWQPLAVGAVRAPVAWAVPCTPQPRVHVSVCTRMCSHLCVPGRSPSSRPSRRHSCL